MVHGSSSKTRRSKERKVRGNNFLNRFAASAQKSKVPLTKIEIDRAHEVQRLINAARERIKRARGEHSATHKGGSRRRGGRANRTRRQRK